MGGIADHLESWMDKNKASHTKTNIFHTCLYFCLSFPFYVPKWREVKHATRAFTLTKIIIDSKTFLNWGDFFVWPAANCDSPCFAWFFAQNILLVHYGGFFWFNKHVKKFEAVLFYKYCSLQPDKINVTFCTAEF